MKHLIASFALLLASQSAFAAKSAVNMEDPAMNPALKAKLVDPGACKTRVSGSTNSPRFIRANGTATPAGSQNLARERSNSST